MPMPKKPSPAAALQQLRARQAELTTAVADGERERLALLRRITELHIAGEPVDAEERRVAELDAAIARDRAALEHIETTMLPLAERRFHLHTRKVDIAEAERTAERVRNANARVVELARELGAAIAAYTDDARALDAIGKAAGVDLNPRFREAGHIAWTLQSSLAQLFPGQFDRPVARLREVDPVDFGDRACSNFVGSLRKHAEDAERELRELENEPECEPVPVAA